MAAFWFITYQTAIFVDLVYITVKSIAAVISENKFRKMAFANYRSSVVYTISVARHHN